jgi:hypothetical protein
MAAFFASFFGGQPLLISGVTGVLLPARQLMSRTHHRIQQGHLRYHRDARQPAGVSALHRLGVSLGCDLPLDCSTRQRGIAPQIRDPFLMRDIWVLRGGRVYPVWDSGRRATIWREQHGSGVPWHHASEDTGKLTVDWRSSCLSPRITSQRWRSQNIYREASGGSAATTGCPSPLSPLPGWHTGVTSTGKRHARLV